MKKQEANMIIKSIYSECKKNTECCECNFYIFDKIKDLNGCIFGEVDITEIGEYEL